MHLSFSGKEVDHVEELVKDCFETFNALIVTSWAATALAGDVLFKQVVKSLTAVITSVMTFAEAVCTKEHDAEIITQHCGVMWEVASSPSTIASQPATDPNPAVAWQKIKAHEAMGLSNRKCIVAQFKISMEAIKDACKECKQMKDEAEEEATDPQIGDSPVRTLINAAWGAARGAHEVGKRLGVAVATSEEPTTLEAALEMEQCIQHIDDTSRHVDDIIGNLDPEEVDDTEEVQQAVTALRSSTSAMTAMAMRLGKDLDELPALQTQIDQAAEEILGACRELT